MICLSNVGRFGHNDLASCKKLKLENALPNQILREGFILHGDGIGESTSCLD
jgi:hypothetical protein